jgi:hypothetical protein
MKYYRLIFKNDDKGVSFSDIVDQEIDNGTFNSMDWEKPIIRHFDGKYLHFLSLDKEYLECMLVGISAFQEMSKYGKTNMAQM